MLKHKFSIYVIENSLELLLKINENYYINSMKNNLGNNINILQNGRNSDINNNLDTESDDEEQIDFSYQNFCKFKQKIFQLIENNSSAKEKKKIFALIKTYKHKK